MLDQHIITNLMIDVGKEIIVPAFKESRQIMKSEQLKDTNITDFTTITDQKAEIWLSTEIKKIYPQIGIVGEESSFGKVRSYEFSNRVLSEHNEFMTVDPIDGTGEFVLGNCNFCTMLSAGDNGQIKQAWLLNPLTGDQLYAEKGNGAFLNGKKIHIQDSSHLQRASIFCYPFPNFEQELSALLQQKPLDFSVSKSMSAENIQMIKDGSAGHGYATIGAVVTPPWDFFPVMLSVSEAGGFVWRGDGKNNNEIMDHHVSVIVATNAKLGNQILQKIKDNKSGYFKNCLS